MHAVTPVPLPASGREVLTLPLPLNTSAQRRHVAAHVALNGHSAARVLLTGAGPRHPSPSCVVTANAWNENENPAHMTHHKVAREIEIEKFKSFV